MLGFGKSGSDIILSNLVAAVNFFMWKIYTNEYPQTAAEYLSSEKHHIHLD